MLYTVWTWLVLCELHHKSLHASRIFPTISREKAVFDSCSDAVERLNVHSSVEKNEQKSEKNEVVEGFRCTLDVTDKCFEGAENFTEQKLVISTG